MIDKLKKVAVECSPNRKACAVALADVFFAVELFSNGPGLDESPDQVLFIALTDAAGRHARIPERQMFTMMSVQRGEPTFPYRGITLITKRIPTSELADGVQDWPPLNQAQDHPLDIWNEDDLNTKIIYKI